MLTDKEKSFIEYWNENRIKEKSFFRQLFPGLPFGIAIGIAILIVLNTGWYERAYAESITETSPVVIIICLILIIVFISIFYKKHRWEMNEQAYLELLAKKKKEDAAQASQSSQNQSI